MVDTPILFVIFNRKETALKSFSSIKKAQPRKLYIASDGPRQNKDGEKEKVESTRTTILSEIDWPCEVKTLFQTENLGCGPGVYTAISWLFDNEERGIILEDDCIAEQSFFKYVDEMLQRYADDQRIGMVAGFNSIGIPKDYPYSYLFSRYKSCWGWATWRRAWRNMDISMNWRKSPQANDILANCGYQGKDITDWRFKLRAVDNNYVSAWDWQWYFSLAAQNQLCIYPAENQISNIGNDADATHTSFSAIVIPSKSLRFPLNSPKFIVPCAGFDKKFCSQSLTFKSFLIRTIPPSIKNRIKKLLSK